MERIPFQATRAAAAYEGFTNAVRSRRRPGRSHGLIGRADVLCTLNHDFYHAAVLDYCGERGVLIASDVDTLGLLRS